jgi:hypothetical protein
MLNQPRNSRVRPQRGQRNRQLRKNVVQNDMPLGSPIAAGMPWDESARHGDSRWIVFSLSFLPATAYPLPAPRRLH